MQFRLQGETIPNKVSINVSSAEILSLIRQRYWEKHKLNLDIYVKNGHLMKYECTSYHNNDYDWVKGARATNEEIERYAFWCQIKELFKG